VVADAQGLYPALLAAGEGDEKAELDQLSLTEQPVQPLPQSVVGDPCVPNDGARVGERRLLTFAEAV
jgi:hypothetical protein